MHSIINMQEVRKQRQIDFEKRMLKEIKLKVLKEEAANLLHTINYKNYDAKRVMHAILEAGVEAFLVGANISKYGYRGDSKEKCKDRNWVESLLIKNEILNTLEEVCFDKTMPKVMFEQVEKFVDHWWSEGYEQGVRKYKLKLI